MMRVTLDTDYLLDQLRLDEYGIGIPFGFLAIGVTLLYASFPGLAGFSSLTGYGRLGLSIVIVLSIASLVMAGYTYHAIDTGWWKLVKGRDDPRSKADE